MRAPTVLSLIIALAGCAAEELEVAETTQPLVVSPSSHDFGPVAITTSASLEVQLSHTGAGSVTLAGVTLDCSTPYAIAGISVALPKQLSIQQSATVSLAFTPTARGGSVCNLLLDFSDTTDRVVPLTGIGVGPELALVSAPSAFGARRINTTSPGQAFTIRNDGDAGYNLTINEVVATADWVVSFDTSTSLAAGASRTGTIAFSPKTVGPRDATIRIDAKDPVDPDETFAVTGTGTSALVAAPASLDLGASVVGVARTAPLAVTDTGTAPLLISAAGVAGGQAPDFSVTAPALPTTIAPGTTNLTVQCRPTAVGARTTTLTLDTDADGAPQDPVVTLTCTGTKPDLSVTTLTSFGSVAPGASAQQTLTVSNANAATTSTLTVAAPTVSGAHAGDFSISPTGAFTLAPGATRNLVVTFTPGGLGARTATLRLTSDDQETPTVDVALAGTGAGPELTVTSPADESVEFGEVMVSSTSAAQTVTVRNDGNASLAITSAALVGANAGDFGLSAPASATLAPGASQSWSVTCAPTAGGARVATLRLVNNDAGESPKDVALTCTGNAVGTLIVLSPAVPVLFAATDVGASSAVVTVTVRNSGGAAVTVPSNPTITPAAFAIASALSSTTIAAGATATIGLRFTPAIDGAVSGTLTIPYDATSLSVGLSGTGRAALVAPSTTALAFGEVLVGATTTTRAVTLTNAGSATLNVAAATLSGAHAASFVVVSPSLPATIAGGTGAAVTVRCTPTAVGPRTATLTIDTDADGATPDPQIALTCDGVKPDVAVSLAALAFGDVPPGVTAPLDLVVSNLGTAPLTVAAPALSGGHAAQFAVSPPGAFTLAPGTSRTLAISFTPSGLGARAATLTLASDDQETASVAVSLTGAGVAAEITVTQPSGAAIAFGDVKVGVASPPASVEVRNDGNATLAVTAVQVTGVGAGSFPIGGAPSADLAGGATSTWTVTCLPLSTGDKLATLELRSNDADEPIRTLALSCRGTQPDLVLTSPSLPVTLASTRVGETSPPVVITVENRGSAPLSLQGTPVVTGPFALSSPPAQTTLAPGGGTTLAVTFTPTLGGTASGALSIDWDATSLHVPLAGLGTVPAFALEPATDEAGELDLGAVCAGQPRTQRFSISNTGTGSFSVLDVASDDPAFAVTPVAPAAFPAALAGGQSATFDLVVAPPLGEVAAMLTITTDLPGAPPEQVLVLARGLEDGIGVAPADGIEFASTEPTESSEPRIVTVTNCEGTALSIVDVAIAGDDADVFAIVAGDVPGPPLEIAPAASAQWSVVFRPVDVGAAEATLRLGAIEVPLRGSSGDEVPDAGPGPDADDGPDGGLEDPAADPTGYYACAAGAPTTGTLVLVVGALALALRRRRDLG